ncbi:hypothetical protein K493DRAFT_406753 [Basidiobolus meristosporus CBS 931.73]|uniref:RING-type domain-containing protein n=1 Tax=Basidiobolus meristosporus CBS 931.73 TaxID=1314790 RepID=A0A1Y1YJ05_9FUNG|nr:hypothetical protein K493DRAFT_406753 [Basidiobolus meristosporus CBS 931.73]|eukprot:ORX98007.1 hypothetical protein K493DRAFT_406753 [Basidiobolus meristosporus CBS 931.73]
MSVCIICTESLATKPTDNPNVPGKHQAPVSVTVCGHLFHTICILHWYQTLDNKRQVRTNHSLVSCPICKQDQQKRDLRGIYCNFESAIDIETLSEDQIHERMIALEQKVQRSEEVNDLLKARLATCEKELLDMEEITLKGLKDSLEKSKGQLEQAKKQNLELKQRISKYQRIQRILELENKEKEPEGVEFLMNYENMSRQQLTEAFFALYQVQRNGIKQLKHVEQFQEKECRKLHAEIEEQKKLRAMKEDRIKTLENWLKNLQTKYKKLQTSEPEEKRSIVSRSKPRTASFNKQLGGFQPMDQLSRQPRAVNEPVNPSKPPLPPEKPTSGSDRSSSEPELPGLRLALPAVQPPPIPKRTSFLQYDGMGGRKRKNPFSK